MSFSESLERIVEQNGNRLLCTHRSWQRVKLGEIASIRNGYPFQSEQFTDNPENGNPLIRIRDVLRSGTDTYYKGSFDSWNGLELDYWLWR